MSSSSCAKVDFSGQMANCFAQVNWPISGGSGELATMKVLKLETSSEKGVKYVSVIGGHIPDGNEKTLRLNGKFGKCLGLDDQSDIIVTKIEGSPLVIKSAVVSCISKNDWEILEENAQVLVNSLRNQLSIVYTGLKFPFWIRKTMSINLKIEKIDPPCEFGLLDFNTELIIPLISSQTCLEIYNDIELRVHPIYLEKLPCDQIVCPSSKLLLCNISHTFIHYDQDYFKTKGVEIDKKGYFYAKISHFDKDSSTTADEYIIVKVYILEESLFEQGLYQQFPKTNPPCIFIHPKLIKDSNVLSPKSFINLSSVSENEFNNLPSKPMCDIQFETCGSSVQVHKNKCFGSTINDCSSFLKNSLLHGGTLANGHLLIVGKEGSGKTTLAQSILKQLTNYPWYFHYEHINCSKLKGKKSETLEKEFHNVFEKASARRPSIITLDNFDVICPAIKTDQQNVAEEFSHFRICETIFEAIQLYKKKQIAIVCTISGLDCLDSYWKTRSGFHFFKKTIHIQPPNKLERLVIFHECLTRYQVGPEGTIDLDVDPGSAGQYEKMDVNSSSKYEWTDNELTDEMKSILHSIHEDHSTPQFLHNIAKKWALLNYISKDNNDGSSSSKATELSREEDIPNLQKIIQNELQEHSNGTEGKNDHQLPTVTWDQIGGLHDVRNELEKILQWPVKYPKLFSDCPIKMPSGILFYGYPGSGKTLLGLAIPSILNTKFIHIKGPELLSKYIGASEQAVQDLFRRAKNSRPCILFFDEFDSLVPRRGHDSTGVTDRVTNQFLAELDGIEGGLRHGVYIIAASARPELIDPAILRPGRLDKHLFFNLPDKGERMDIVQKLSKEVNFTQDVNWNEIIDQTENYSGADLHALIFSANLAAIKEYLDNVRSEGKDKLGKIDDDIKIVVTKDTLLATLQTFKPSLPSKELLNFKMIYEQFQGTGTERNKGDPTTTGRKVIERGKKATLA